MPESSTALFIAFSSWALEGIFFKVTAVKSFSDNSPVKIAWLLQNITNI